MRLWTIYLFTLHVYVYTQIYLKTITQYLSHFLIIVALKLDGEWIDALMI